ncbi:MAG: phosphate signaling complex protein PhoU [Verrucomicrobiales bacterium]|nr:phosphate signaling complex protein PhoU [Verrucomicrobiales bacterium]
MATHLEASLQRDIDLIRKKILEMSGRCESALRDVLTAFVEGNRQLAYLVILRDQHIDELERQVDRLCMEFLVRQQPVAKHLRLAYTAFKINGELERIGDYAESIARQVLKLNHAELNISFERFQESCDLATRMLHDATRSFVDENEQLAVETMKVEEQIDALRRQTDAELVAMSQEGRIPVESLTPLMTISRRFERTSDQAKNICGQVRYMCTGEYLRHQGAEVFRVLFVDAHHGVASRMAEAIAESLEFDRVHFSSAGVDPREPDPRLETALAEAGVAFRAGPVRSLDQVPNLDHHQVIVALDHTARAAFPGPPSKTVTFEWSVPDVGVAQTPGEGSGPVLKNLRDYLETHIKDLVAAIMGEQ